MSIWKSIGDAAANTAKTVTKAAGEVVTNTTEVVSKTAGEVVSNTTEVVTKVTANTAQQAANVLNKFLEEKKLKQSVAEAECLELSEVSEDERLAFYGALFAMANADGFFDKEEMNLIFGFMDLERISESGKRQVQSYVIEPPSLETCLQQLSQSDPRLRFGLMMNLVDTAWVNDELDVKEEEAIALAQEYLGVTDTQVQAIAEFIHKMRESRLYYSGIRSPSTGSKLAQESI